MLLRVSDGRGAARWPLYCRSLSTSIAVFCVGKKFLPGSVWSTIYAQMATGREPADAVARETRLNFIRR